MVSSPLLDEVLCEDADVVLYRAHTDDGQTVLAKVLKADRPSSAEYESLRREADGARAAGADVAAEPAGLMTVDGRPTLLFRDDGGTSLMKLLHAPLPLARFFPISLALVEAIETIHGRQLVHGELHPRDILVLWTGRVELIGFGHVEDAAAGGGPAAKRPASTWPYLAPEQTGRAALPVDRRTDLYTVGMLLFEMLAGRRPFEFTDMVGWFHAHCAVVPPSVHTIVPEVPPVLAQIVGKLLSKAPEARYQSAAGLRHDLERCAAEWTARGTIEPFPLASADPPPPLRFTGRIHGRRDEMRSIIRSLERVSETSQPEAVFVSGPSGVGKSTLLHEALRQGAVAQRRALVAIGKCEPQNVNTPCVPIVEALEGLLRTALESSADQPEAWRLRFERALGVNVHLLGTLIPGLARLMGVCFPAKDVAITENRDRLVVALAQFIAVFSTDGRPVVVAIDDLQWADTTTLDLFTRWVCDRTAPILLVGAYRCDEQSELASVGGAIAQMKERGASVTEIRLEVLSREAVAAWVADALSASVESVTPLADVISEKTGNTPFFVARFLESLRDRGLVRYSTDTRSWQWDIDAVRAEAYIDDVANLIADNIDALSPSTQNALGHFAAYGMSADLDMLALVLGCSEEVVLDELDGAFRARLIARVGRSVRFLHDHIQAAAYAHLGERKADVHLHIARVLHRRLPESALQEHVFEVVRQYEMAGTPLVDEDERVRVARLELSAGHKAQAATDFVSAAAFLDAGRKLLDEGHWETEHALAFDLHVALARSLLVKGDHAAAKALGVAVLSRARTGVEKACIHELLTDLYLLHNDVDAAVDECLVGLRALGVDLPAHPSDEIVTNALAEVLRRFDGQLSAHALTQAPAVDKPEVAAVCNLVSTILAPASQTDWNLAWLAAAAGVTRSLSDGNVSSSPVAYAAFALRLAKEERYDEARRLGEAAYALARKPENLAHRPRAGFVYGAFLSYLSSSIRDAIELLREELEIARMLGDLSYACYLAKHKAHFRFFAGDPLADLDLAAQTAAGFADHGGYPGMRDLIVSMRRLFMRL